MAKYKLYTLSEAAEKLGLSPATLRSQIRHGSVIATKLGHIWFMTESDIDNYRQVSLGKQGRRKTKAELRKRAKVSDAA
jgi:predicted site-specific integrase-resolvase